MRKKYKKVAVGGTFDRLHAGHRSLLMMAFDLGERVVVGLTSDEFVKTKKLAKVIENYEKRFVELKIFLDESGFGDRYEIVKLNDVVGTAVSDTSIEAIVVSEQTIVGAKTINQEREKQSLKILPYEVAAMVHDQSSEYLSSSRIRAGQVSSAGEVYELIFEKNIKLSPTQLQMLKFPMGKLIRTGELAGWISKHNPTKIGVVGDVSLNMFLEKQLPFDIGIFDNKTSRQNIELVSLKKLKARKVKNEPGSVEAQAVEALKTTLRKSGGCLEIDGEEDLLVLPLLLMLPLKSVVFYGQPGEGLVMVEVNELNKNRWYQFLR